MSNAQYPLDRSAYLLVDPYNDILSEGGKVYPRIEPMNLLGPELVRLSASRLVTIAQIEGRVLQANRTDRLPQARAGAM